MTNRYFMLSAVAGLTGATVLACASSKSTVDEAALADTDTADEQATVTSVNADGTWVANALTPAIINVGSCYARATFTGPAGKTRRMGVCALTPYKNASGQVVPCTTVADCANAPTTLPTGGFRYCTKPEGGTVNYCFYRGGPPTTHCAGTPALGGAQVPPGSYSTPAVSRTTDKISYACFEGCNATDPSASSTLLANEGGCPGGCGGKK